MGRKRGASRRRPLQGEELQVLGEKVAKKGAGEWGLTIELPPPDPVSPWPVSDPVQSRRKHHGAGAT